MNDECKNLLRLEEDTETILRTLSPKEIDGAINWGDLHCVEAVLSVNKDGLEHYRVLIEEAEPENMELHNVMYDQLTGYYGWPPTIEVVTEW